MAQTSYNIHVKSAIQQIARRFKHNEIVEAVTQTGPLPAYVNNFVNIISADVNVQSSNGPIATIDVQPDYRNVIAALCFHITRLYPSLEIKAFPAVTPPALLAYCLALVYAHALLNDETNIRRRQSAHAHTVYTSRYLDRIVAMLRNLPVPPFMNDLLNGLKRSYDERKPKLIFVHSLACYHMPLDFGRAIPITAYLEAHNLIASQPTNTAPDQILFKWLTTLLTTLPLPLEVANFLGVQYGPAHFVNWFAELNFSLFNPITNRTQTQRPTLTKIDLTPQDLGNDINIVNPYIHLLGIDSENLTLVESHLQSVALLMEDNYPNAPKLGSILQPEKTQIMLNHYYSEIPLPTWHTSVPHKEKLATNTTSAVAANTLQYRVGKVNSNPYSITFPASKSLYVENLYLAKDEKLDKTKPSFKYSGFRSMRDVKPDVRHFCPFETSSNNIYSNLICGRLIEYEELTSCSVPQPNPANTILEENSYFLESAVPMNNIDTDAGNLAIQTCFISRTIHPARQPTVRIDLLNRSTDRIPYFNPLVPAVTDDPIPGFHKKSNLSNTQLACNSFCTTIKSGSSQTELPSGQTKLHAWSSYRYFNIHQSTDVPITNRKLMLLNFRTHHGTNVTLVETPHPSVSIRRP